MASLPVSTPVAALSNIQSILFATDFSFASERALKYALAIAAASKSRLFVVHVLPLGEAPPSSDFGVREIDPTRKHAEDHLRKLENSGVLAGTEHSVLMERGGVWDVLAKVVKNNSIDLIALGTHGRGGIKKLIMGSVAEQVLRVAPCPVLTIGACAPELTMEFTIQRILFATDFSSGSLQAFPYALTFAQLFDAKLILLHVLDPAMIGWSGQIDHLREQARERLKALVPEGRSDNVEIQMQFGSPGYAIVTSAENEKTDLIVMGTRATTSIAASTHLPWTVAHHVVCHARCPVLTVLSEVQHTAR